MLLEAISIMAILAIAAVVEYIFPRVKVNTH